MPTSHSPGLGRLGAAKRPPSAHAVLERAADAVMGRDRLAVRAVVHDLLAEERSAWARGLPARDADGVADALVRRLVELDTWQPASVINATGVILHTNLGRAPWAPEAARAGLAAATRYVYLELDRDTGRRGPRAVEAEEHLRALTGAESALVVNNNAAALMLAVGGLARRSTVVVSRGELAEIGGGVRIPEILRRAGVRLAEVGTTNKTRIADYAEALGTNRVGAVLRVHASNYRIEGFTERPPIGELVELAHASGVPVIEDIGSGALIDTARYGLSHEPMPGESVAAGIDVVTFSGDKLLGGPQAGLIVGRREVLARLRRDPLARAVRADKVTLAALTSTLAIYRGGRAEAKVPIWRMIAAPPAELERRARTVAGADGALHVRSTQATVGGGSLPGDTLPSFAVAIETAAADRLHAQLRAGDPAVIGRVETGSILLDLRTVLPEDDARVAVALRGLEVTSG